jgi:hypothetical protein
MRRQGLGKEEYEKGEEEEEEEEEDEEDIERGHHTIRTIYIYIYIKYHIS